ncbi:hypothetical protein [Geminisphaera colitermitum]|uniref:hypothetical protein n=1 Tax=Geminisphaera colitermitum TaxID=1148786 RepID=UPI0018E330E8|nr:hypothetical protein [Geminisphaera colitermitum]
MNPTITPKTEEAETSRLLSPELLAEAREWLDELVWRDMPAIEGLTDAEVEHGIARHYDGGIPGFMLDFSPNEAVRSQAKALFPTPDVFAARAIGELTDEHIAYAGDPARGEYRGFAALGDLMDHNQFLLNCGCPAPDGTQERLDLINDYAAAITTAIIAHYNAA